MTKQMRALPGCPMDASFTQENPRERESDLWAIRAEPASGQRTGDTTRLGGWKNFAALEPQASADGKRLIAAREHTQTGIYIGDLAIGNAGFTPRRFNHDDWYDYVAAWTKDSKAVVFDSKRNGRWAIFEQQLDSPSPETLIAGPDATDIRDSAFKETFCTPRDRHRQPLTIV